MPTCKIRSIADQQQVIADTGVPSTMMIARRVVRPDEQRQAEPRHVRARACVWMVTMKFSPVRIEEKPAMKMPTTVSTTCVLRIGVL